MLEFRTVCISDVHLGTRGCKAEYLLDFLRHVRCEKLYLVGDILDLWRLRKGGWYWHDLHQAMAQRFFDMACSGTEVIYIPGNHDEALRGYLGTEFKGIHLRERCVHQGVAGRRLLVLHGDEYDTVITAGGLLSVLGCFTYDTLVEINRWVNLYRARRGLPYWSLAGFLKSRVKNAQRYIADYEEALLRNACRRGYDGVICGHIHHPALWERRDGFYGNCGDWVENCTALTEDPQGRWRLIHWVTESARLLEVKEKTDLASAG